MKVTRFLWRITTNFYFTNLFSVTKAINAIHISQSFRWSGFLLCAIAMFLVIFPMFTFPKKLPPRHKKKKKFSVDVSDDDVLKEKSNTSEQVDKKVSSMGFGKNVRGKVYLLNKCMHETLVQCPSKCGPRRLGV
jgi:hypothetical protein